MATGAPDFRIEVTDHAMWRAAERFPRFDTVAIEDEVRAALRAGRVSAQRSQLGLHPKSDPRSLYVWTEDGGRVYAINHDEDVFVVMTTMRPGDAGASLPGPLKPARERRSA